MLDLHTPPEAAHTWKDFLIHIVTNVIGLLSAVALEQTVEFFHHRHEVAETRAALHEEMQKNIVLFHQNVEGHSMTMRTCITICAYSSTCATIQEHRTTNSREFFIGLFSQDSRIKRPGLPRSIPTCSRLFRAPKSERPRIAMKSSTTRGRRISQLSPRSRNAHVIMQTRPTFPHSYLAPLPTKLGSSSKPWRSAVYGLTAVRCGTAARLQTRTQLVAKAALPDCWSCHKARSGNHPAPS